MNKYTPLPMLPDNTAAAGPLITPGLLQEPVTAISFPIGGTAWDFPAEDGF